jgi:hypothetical protein
MATRYSIPSKKREPYVNMPFICFVSGRPRLTTFAQAQVMPKKNNVNAGGANMSIFKSKLMANTPE